jgi:hypothetical protein
MSETQEFEEASKLIEELINALKSVESSVFRLGNIIEENASWNSEEKKRLLTPSEAQKSLRRVTFKVRIERNPAGAWEWGTGFFISKDGYALTAFHHLPDTVVQANGGTMDIFYREQWFTVECLLPVSLPEPEGDIAALKLPHSTSGLGQYLPVAYYDTSLSFQQRVQFWAGRPICIFGFPFEESGQAERFVSGIIDGEQPLVDRDNKSRHGYGPAITGSVEWLRIIASRAQRLEGISGAPILDRVTGWIIGVEHRYLPNQKVIYGTEIGQLLAKWPNLTQMSMPLTPHQ